MVAGGGVAVNGPRRQVHVSASYPLTATERAWRATVVNDSGAARTFTVYAQCLPLESGLTYSRTTSEVDPSSAGFNLDSPCATPASIPLSGGVSWLRIQSQFNVQSQVHIASSGPINSVGGVATIPDTAWRTGTSNDAGPKKTLVSEQVCAPA
jgi:hypothetical protein